MKEIRALVTNEPVGGTRYKRAPAGVFSEGYFFTNLLSYLSNGGMVKIL